MPPPVVVRWKATDAFETITWPAYRTTKETSVVTGRTRTIYHRGELDPVEIRFNHALEPEFVLTRPRGYLVHAGWPQIAEIVDRHGLAAVSIAEPVETRGRDHPHSPIRSSPRRRSRAPSSSTTSPSPGQLEDRKVPAGSLWIPADQPDFEVAVQLFEPEAPDSLLRWGELSSIFEMKTYIGIDKLEELAGRMLEDEAVRAAWETRPRRSRVRGQLARPIHVVVSPDSVLGRAGRAPAHLSCHAPAPADDGPMR